MCNHIDLRFVVFLLRLQIASTVVDYKYSLHGLSEDSDDYRRVLSEVCAIVLAE